MSFCRQLGDPLQKEIEHDFGFLQLRPQFRHLPRRMFLRCFCAFASRVRPSPNGIKLIDRFHNGLLQNGQLPRDLSHHPPVAHVRNAASHR
jgi:hypothetical protein